MPNWCNNTLELAHEDPEMIARAKRAFLQGELLNEFIPVPEDLKIVAGRVGADEDENQKDLVAQMEVNKSKHGYTTWYDFCVGEWGTKWDVGGDGYEPTNPDPNNTTLTFDSAWAPPITAMEKLQDLGFSVRLYYYEPGMCFAGIYDENGDDYYEFSEMTSEQVADELPEELDDMFGISEIIHQYEAEEERDE
jgi:hypothetical protein